MTKFPKDNATALKKFYGDPAEGEVGPQLIMVKPPFHLWYGDKKVTKLSFHKKAAPALERVFDKIWNYYGKDQKLLDKLEISFYSGAYNHRLVRGSKTKWSNHAFGAAYDMDAEDNALGAGRGDIPYPVIAAFKSEGFSWGGDYKGRTDPMHFEACDRGDPERTFAQWLAHYDCPPMGSSKKEVKVSPVIHTVKDEPKAKVEAKPPPLDKADIVDAIVVADEIIKDETVVVPATHDMPPGVYSVDTEIVQTLLSHMGYHSVGEIDGRFGSQTRGAIAAFLNDRGIKGHALKSSELKAELNKAMAEDWKRPIGEKRANATPQQLAPSIPEVNSSINAERTTFWGAIVTAGSAAITGITKAAGDAVEMLDPIKAFLSEVPWPVWVGGTFGIAILLYAASRMAGNAKNAATKAYQEGART